MTWWQRLLAWLSGSEPGTRKEQVEDWIEANAVTIQNFVDHENTRKNARGHYFQRLKGWLNPTDDSDTTQVNDFAGKLPVWVDYSIDVWEAPPRDASIKGYTLNIWVTELDTTVWVLRIDSAAGSLGWSQVQ